MNITIGPLTSNLVTPLNKIEPVRSETSGKDGTSDINFSDILTESFKTVAATDTADKVSALELLTGETDDMSGLLLDAAKAEISLSLALQIRNKVIDAYNEIMRMSV